MFAIKKSKLFYRFWIFFFSSKLFYKYSTLIIQINYMYFLSLPKKIPRQRKCIYCSPPHLKYATSLRNVLLVYPITPLPFGFQPLCLKTNQFSPENDVGRSPQILAAVLFFHQVRGWSYAVFIFAVLRISFEIPRVRFEYVVRTAVRTQRHYHFRASLRLGQRPWPIVVKTFVVCNTGWINGGGGNFFPTLSNVVDLYDFSF